MDGLRTGVKGHDHGDVLYLYLYLYIYIYRYIYI